MRLPLRIFEERYKVMIGTCMVTEPTFGVALIRSGPEVGGPAEVHSVGTTARIVELDRLPDGEMKLVALGVERFRLLERLPERPYPLARVEVLVDSPDDGLPELVERVTRLFRRYLVGRGIKADQAEQLQLPTEPAALSYLLAATVRAPSHERQRLLELPWPEQRLRRELALLEWAVGGPDAENARAFSLN
jgi:Lon protease-like protein